MSSEKEPRNLPTSSYPTWLMGLVAPEEMKQRMKERSQQGGGGNYDSTQKPANIEPSTVSNTQAPLYSHTITVPDGKQITEIQPRPVASYQSQQQQQQQRRKQPARYRTREEQDEHDRDCMVKFGRRLFAEFLGTFIFVFLVAGVALEFNLTGHAVDGLRNFAGLDQTGCGWASGLTLTFLVYSMGEISGAHFNPCITWAFTLRGLFPVIWLLPYWLVQFAGAILAGAFLQAFYWHNAFYATTNVNPHNQWVTGFAYEALLTFFFINVILAIATRGGNVGPHAALADGFALAVVVMIGLSYTGTAVNPWRALGPGIINGQRDNLWVYVAGPFLGSTVSVLAVWALNGPLKSEDYGAAQGSGEAQASDGTPEKEEEEKGDK